MKKETVKKRFIEYANKATDKRAEELCAAIKCDRARLDRASEMWRNHREMIATEDARGVDTYSNYLTAEEYAQVMINVLKLGVNI